MNSTLPSPIIMGTEEYDDVGSIVLRLEFANLSSDTDTNMLLNITTATPDKNRKPMNRTTTTPSSSSTQKRRSKSKRTNTQQSITTTTTQKQAATQEQETDNTDDEMIVLNVGGEIYYTQRSVLCSHENSTFDDMLNGRVVSVKDDQGRYFVDGDGRVFRYILHFLRRGELPWPGDENEQKILRDELRFYGLDQAVPNSPPEKMEFRLLQIAGTALSKLNDIDNSYQITTTMTNTAITTLQKLKELDSTYQIHKTLGTTVANGLDIAIKLDNKYDIHKRLTNVLVSGCHKAYQIDQDYLLHEKVTTAIATGITTAQVLNDKYGIQDKVGKTVKFSFDMACRLDKDYKVQERVSHVLVGSLKYLQLI